MLDRPINKLVLLVESSDGRPRFPDEEPEEPAASHKMKRNIVQLNYTETLRRRTVLFKIMNMFIGGPC